MIITKVFPQIFPDELKVADIFPIFKIKYKDGKFSYRNQSFSFFPNDNQNVASNHFSFNNCTVHSRSNKQVQIVSSTLL